MGDPATRDAYRFGAFELDPARRTLTRAGQPVALTPTVLDVLVHLVENAGRVVSKDELLEAVWPGRLVEETNVKQTVFTLRRALAAGGGGEALIANESRRGYRFEASVERVARSPGGGPETPAAIIPATLAKGRAGRHRIWIGLGVLAMLVVAGLEWLATRSPAKAGSTVVLADFDNRTGQAVFDRTLEDLLRIDLSQSPFVNLVSEKQARQTLELMRRPAEAPITAAVAQEICVRNNGDAIVVGGIGALGARYVITLSATDCSGLRQIAAVKAEVVGSEAVAPAIDKLIARVRAKLGESRRSIDAYNVPLLREQTASLQALKAYSEAKALYDRGHLIEAIALDRHAVELDPGFSAAYANLGVIYVSLYDDARSAFYLRKAYALRDGVNERAKLQTIALYAQFVSRDYQQAIQNFQLWTTIYPRDVVAWSNLANAEDYFGRHAQAVADGQRALALEPRLENPYAVLARAELAAGDLSAARKVGTLAVTRGLAADSTHRELIRVADALDDPAGVAKEALWAARNPPSPRVREAEAEMALSRGRVAEARSMFDEVSRSVLSRGAYDYLRPDKARLLAWVGDDREGLRLIEANPFAADGVTPDPDALYLLARYGDARRARRFLGDWLRSGPSDTLLHQLYAPEIQAALALRGGDARGAIEALATVPSSVSRSFEVPYLRGEAWLAAGKGRQAEAAFREVLAHRGWSPESPLYPLAHLGLARALRLEGDTAGSLAAYQGAAAGWGSADADFPPLRAARRELGEAVEPKRRGA